MIEYKTKSRGKKEKVEDRLLRDANARINRVRENEKSNKKEVKPNERLRSKSQNVRNNNIMQMPLNEVQNIQLTS